MIILMRHGQDRDNARGILNGHRDLDLTDLGRSQVQLRAEQLREVSLDVIITSPLKRAYASARIVANHLNCVQIEVNKNLIERDFGCLTGKSIAEIPHYASTILIVDGVNYFLDALGAESFPALLNRAKGILQSLQVTHPDQNLLLVTHGDLIKMLRAAYYGWDWEKGLKTPNPDNAGLVYLHKQ
ncbi:MAG: histidine phosphatase family protein [Prochloron sp. SP5CPC1]|nr:histidine phosphatase family protein [Candidatus Paraprochloron terpiosi SP5CPC1]